MKQFLINYRGFDIYVWTTGKFEVYLDGKPIGISGQTLNEVMGDINARQDMYNDGQAALPDTQPRFNIFERNGQ